MTQEEFAQSIKTKYPQYKDIDTGTLVTKIVEKYPVYKSQITDFKDSTETPKEPGFFSRVGTNIKNRVSEAKKLTTESANQYGPNATITPTAGASKRYQAVGQYAGILGDVISEGFKSIDKALPEDKRDAQLLKDMQTPGTEAYKKEQTKKEFYDSVGNKLSAWAEKHPDAAKNLESTFNIASVVPVLGAPAEIKAAFPEAKAVTQEGLSTVKSAVTNTANKVSSAVSKTKSTIEDAGSSFFSKISQPDVSEATKVSLNPTEALKGTGQDISVSVGGKMKPLSELTITETSKLKSVTAKNVENFTKQAEKFSKDRSVAGGSPVEMVGSRTDKALTFADKKRQLVGNKMGVIEEKFADTVIPMKENTFKSFSDIVDYAKNPKYGVQSQNAPVVQKLIEDFDALTTNGLTVAERNSFVRTWQQYLSDAKDAFGNFKENATANTKIQNAVNSLKNETVEAIPDKTYRRLRKQYAEYKKLEEIGNQLLGKDGLLGERIKGAATVKRAVQSNSDAGARQFLIKLRELTGYDAIKEGDLALTAMENVGDYQGLNLLNIIKEGKTGLVNKVLEKGQDILVGNKSRRVEKYIKK